LMLGLLVNIGCRSYHINSSTHGLRLLQEWVNSCCGHWLPRVIDIGIGAMGSLSWCRSHMLTLRRKVVEGTCWQARYVSARSSNPHSRTLTTLQKQIHQSWEQNIIL
jgi:hypothetical protein